MNHSVTLGNFVAPVIFMADSHPVGMRVLGGEMK